MPDPIEERPQVVAALRMAMAEAERYLRGIDADHARRADALAVAESIGGELPEQGIGALAAIAELARASDAATRSSGPRFFHWVTGGGTPAALAADWLTSVYDNNSFAWESSPLGTRLEELSIAWLKDLFGLPGAWGGVLTTGATMANFTALAAARRWWGERHGADVDREGLGGLPAVPVFSSGYIHVSATKALAMLGIGRETVRRLSRDDVGRLDVRALEDALKALGGAPAIVVANAGEVNAGDFDPIERMAELCDRYGAWLHVDGAFGLFAAVSPRTRPLVAGIGRAHSAISDGHKWLNVPYDSGFAFVRDPLLLAHAFAFTAPYLPGPGQHPNFGMLAPEASRRARAIAVWATLRAYGREGHRAMVERHLDLAQHLARRIDEAADFERVAEVPLNIVAFRYRPAGLAAERLDDLNARIGTEVLTDGRIYMGTTRYRGMTVFRPAIVNWRTTEADVDLIIDVVRELGERLASGS
ncbi:MAG TPA: pyridoxal-dependent decarboxylase [Candidatus Limnocylindria bacterium]|nr:pyridoxal-dependent decarboxylase [Candidatus Limnocylindria bacterium]